MLFNTSPEKFWNLIAKKYAADPIADLPAYETKIKTLKTYLEPEMNLLDIGCATGTQCADLSGSVKQVTGIDISSKLLAIATERLAEKDIHNVDFIETNAFDERFQAHQFDAVMAFHVMHFYIDINTIINRIYELLRPGGIFISETGCLADRGKFLGSALKTAGAVGFLPRMSIHSDQQLEAAIKNAGFEILDKTKYSKDPDAEFTYVAKKP